MGQKYLIVPTQNFSGTLEKGAEATFRALPYIVRKFLNWFKGKVFAVLDESSWIKTNQPMPEEKKSQRTRTIKQLQKYTEARAILTGTLKSKTPLNVVDQFQFLSDQFFTEDMDDIAEDYCIMMNLQVGRGRRIIIPQKDYTTMRAAMTGAWRLGMMVSPEAAEMHLEATMTRLNRKFGIDFDKLDHILAHRGYSPFVNQKELEARIAPWTMTVNREDVFDVSFDEFVNKPIKRPVQVSKQAKKLGNELVKLGFTDDLVLGKAPALELMIRLQDLANGFEPIKTKVQKMVDGVMTEVDEVTYRPLPENPKLDELENLLNEIDTDKEQVVVWCSRTNAFDSISERLTKMGISHVKYDGGESAKKKKAAEEAFENGTARVFLANEASAAYGLNCLRDCAYIVWYCCDASVERHHQAKHRILRGQSDRPKFAFQIYVKDSVEERNIRALNVGQELLSGANSQSVFMFNGEAA